METCPLCNTQHDDTQPCPYTPPTLEEWETIVDAMRVYGLDASLEGGGAACTFIAINLPDGRAVAFGDNGDVWTGDVYTSRKALDEAQNAVTSIQTDVPTRCDGTDRYHDPESLADAARRAFLRITPPDPEGMNKDRAEWARVAVQAFATQTGLDTDAAADGIATAITDLLADLGHLCDREGLSLPAIWQTAAMHYNEETDNQGDQLDTIPS